MKDHELRELINDVTAVARIYAHTQQLREQIAHLITPAFKKLECEKAFCQGQVAGQKEVIVMHEEQTMRQREKMIACLKDKNSLLADIETIRQLAGFIADSRILFVCNKAISNIKCTELPPTTIPSSDNTP